MIQKYFTYTLLFYSLSVFSQTKTEKVKYTYPGGQVSSEGTMVDGKPDGYWKTYYPNGVIKSEGKRLNFLLDSTWVFYSELGDTTEKINYLNGKKSGFYFKYQTTQNKNEIRKTVIVSKELYINDLREGPSYTYFTNGKTKDVNHYSNGKIINESYEYDENGTLITIFLYKTGTLRNIEKINRNDNTGKKNGVWREFYPDGKLKTETSYKNGVQYGLKKEYDVTGKLTSSINYVEGNIDLNYSEEDDSIEIKEEKFDNGNLKRSGAYKSNVPIGVHKIYNESGELYYAQVYDNKGSVIAEGGMNKIGRKENKWIEYYRLKEKRTEGFYRNGKKNGQWIYYFTNGNIEQKGTFENDLYDGNWTWFDKEAHEIKSEQFSGGKENGLYVEKNINGDTIVKGEYIDGQKTGFWIEKEGNILFKGNYQDGAKNGQWKGFFENNEVYFIGNFLQGNPDGKHVFYSESKVIRETQYYSNGLKTGSWTKYNEDGSVKLVIAYKNDTEFMINGFKIDRIGK
jgi:uncharacterized protein